MRRLSCNVTSGFTAIELLITISLVAILATMAVRSVLRTLRRTAVEQAISTLTSTADHARLLAIRGAATADNKRYGVVLARDAASGQVYAAVIYGGPNDGKPCHADRIITANAKRQLPANARVWLEETELGSDEYSKELAWYYDYATGLPLLMQDGNWSTPGASIGTRGYAYSNEYGAAGITTPPSVLYPGNAEVPGLTIRSRDQQVRRALAVYATSSLVATEF